MIHIMTDDFRIYDRDTYINCSEVYAIIDLFDMQAEEVSISDIFHKELESIDTNGYRYKNADPDYPCIVVEGLDNPQNQKYRMIDGRHRLLKTMVEDEEDFIECYILTFDQIEGFIQDEKI